MAAITVARATPRFERLVGLLDERRPALVLSGAGVSTESGIPDYRDADGEWKRRQPIQYREFVDQERSRRRYWARSLAGWPHFARATPGPSHLALARLQAAGVVGAIVTQNVDGLHERAGSAGTVDLHGRLDRVACLDCGAVRTRDAIQHTLAALNPGWQRGAGEIAPDGDVDLDGADYAAFRVPDCPECGGTLKPTVVFFGESVPRERVDGVRAALARSGLLLCVGTSLMVFSGYRFVREAVKLAIPVAIVNLGRTRGDDDADLKLSTPCGRTLEALAERLAPSPSAPAARPRARA